MSPTGDNNTVFPGLGEFKSWKRNAHFGLMYCMAKI